MLLTLILLVQNSSTPPWTSSRTSSMGSPKEGDLEGILPTGYRLSKRLTERSTREVTPTEHTLANKAAKLVIGHCLRFPKGKTNLDRLW